MQSKAEELDRKKSILEKEVKRLYCFLLAPFRLQEGAWLTMVNRSPSSCKAIDLARNGWADVCGLPQTWLVFNGFHVQVCWTSCRRTPPPKSFGTPNDLSVSCELVVAW